MRTCNSQRVYLVVGFLGSAAESERGQDGEYARHTLLAVALLDALKDSLHATVAHLAEDGRSMVERSAGGWEVGRIRFHYHEAMSAVYTDAR